MKLIALDSSGAVASVALFTEGKLLGEYSIDHKSTHSQTLLPMLNELCRRTDFVLAESDAVAVASGPGSFTGLRIGGAAAKGIAMALNIPVLPVPTLEGLCYRAMEWPGLICPMMDARRQQIYSGIYRFEEGELRTLFPGEAISAEEQIRRLNEAGEAVYLLGDGTDACREQIASKLHCEYRIAPQPLRYQSAAAVGLRAMALGDAACVPAGAFVPVYLRRSQAEREREERLAGEKA
ncbi:MAG: tRNA (adenosine(37)-N6)-threonylcarbamoyltransferase complex dimerization subunit type 1 TsaB [Lachnospiraceae bacterium]|nr:tRNA (adenosine(37)-N6)-threonylcarbamoyltransferase complex dimerization subunit type 1 TsaB [Lachnospiraceae bacterium]